MLLIFASLPAADAQAGDNSHQATFAVDAPVVLVPTTVIDRKGAIVSGLPSDDFLVAQDNVPQRITSFAEQDVPVSVGIVFDTSGSMRNALPQAKSVLRSFLDACNPEDEAFLYTVATRPEKDFGFTNDFNTLTNHIVFADAGGSTALVDTIYAAMLQSRSAHHTRRARQAAISTTAWTVPRKPRTRLRELTARGGQKLTCRFILEYRSPTIRPATRNRSNCRKSVTVYSFSTHLLERPADSGSRPMGAVT